MQPSNHRLLGFLLRARAAGRRRAVVVAIADLLLAGALSVLLSLLITTFSLRGDLVLAANALLLAAGLGATAYRVFRGAGVTYRDELGTARMVARTPGLLSERGDAQTDTVLRHEILGAAQLMAGLDDRNPPHQHLGSPDLAAFYVDAVGERLAGRDPGLAIPYPRWRRRWVALAGLGILAAGASGVPGIDEGARLFWSATDGRPPEPPRPVWSALALTITYPAHTGRPTREVPNPSGALRLPAGTQVAIDLQATEPAHAVRVVVTYDAAELSEAPPPEFFDLAPDSTRPDGWLGSFTVRGGGVWTIVLLRDEDDADQAHRSAPLALELEPDLPPEIELLPLPPAAREPSELSRVDVRFTARDDFGLNDATLVWQIEDGELHRLPAGSAPPGSRQWRHRNTWDLSTIPIEERSELTYWIEVRDNDPGLGLQPLPDPPGKVASSAKQRLSVRDEESEHARNIESLRELRDLAVDLLAGRLTTKAFVPADIEHSLGALATARELHSQAQALLAAFASLIDNLSIDTMVREREVAGVIAVHKRLLDVHRREQKLHATMPPEAEARRPEKVPPLLGRLGRHNRKEIAQLEDEIIRLDDLVDTQIIERLERLLDRAEATLAKLIELIQQHEAGDESVRPQIDQLEQRLREDLRRISEARSLLRKELGSEFMNLDALRRLEQQLENAQLGRLLDQPQGGAMKRAQELREQLMQMRGEVQGRASENAQMSAEEKQRMQLLRELGRLKDEQKTLQGQTQGLHQTWREAVADETARDADATGARARRLREDLEKINDARLGREARRGWEDAREQLQKLEAMKTEPDARALELFEAAQRAVDGLDEAVGGSKAGEKEGDAIRRLERRARAMRDDLLGRLPKPGQALEGEQLQQYQHLQQAQEALRKRADALMQDRISTILPQPGRQAMRAADHGMERSADSLEGTDGGRSMQGQQLSLDGIQRAIDSLRQQSPPPPTAANPAGEASTEAERDKSWREQLMDAMREEAPEGFDDEVQRYYEELLK